MNRIVIAMLALAAVAANEPNAPAKHNGGDVMTIKVTSSAFEDEAMIPAKYTADGENISPPLAWQGIPEGTKSIAIISDDPDAPRGTWVHWLVWNIPPEQMGMPENVPDDKKLSSGAVQGQTSFGSVGYGGPAPPSGTHRYYFKVYALDTMLDLKSKADKQELEKAMQGRVLAQGQIMGRYSRKR